ncbi:arabinan endo-1,5-alpha-L-arabinosidase [Actinopolymorpha rutila]|uniref:Arabinan endo-1,5-alpha-L-arabinosidase n=1 Tax=Actinopolymorpha rutila TaxID=446787 RepID=A0A852ZF87_9ACTN|nr:arabinan endo-1,5-alpha-L-arabinosidase [Actinopolymorpha rutila]NYH88329.1 arabinan endo-1,5-alpha-L-arabinosidase [Actinopolymorpha rutila]
MTRVTGIRMARSVFLAVAVLVAALVATSADPPAMATAASSARQGPAPAPAPAARPPAQLSGDLHAHDPALIREHGPRGSWYVFSTGDPAVGDGTVQIRRSADLGHWSYNGTVFSRIPSWVREAVPGVTNLWAPEVTFHDGRYYLYYAASTFGSNRSVIGLATNTTLDSDDPGYRWVDRGEVTTSVPSDDFNAIDPGVVTDAEGTPWLAFGSFWSGIRMLRLRWPDGKVAPGQGEPLRLADRHVPPNAIEAAYVVARNGWYYLFVSLDFCCRGTDSTYKIAVGRSRSVSGPYVDELGTPLAHGGGTVILSERGTMIGPGGQSVFGDVLAFHYYDATANGDFRLGLRRIQWTAGGWPRVADRP